jgi:hypothetical protein
MSGYEMPLTENLGLAPVIDYAAGSLGDVRNLLAVERGAVIPWLNANLR